MTTVVYRLGYLFGYLGYRIRLLGFPSRANENRQLQGQRQPATKVRGAPLHVYRSAGYPPGRSVPDEARTAADRSEPPGEGWQSRGQEGALSA